MAITSKMKDFTSSTKEKQKTRAEIAKLSALIKGEEQALEKVYSQIGKLYVSEHGSDRENGFVEMLDAVSTAEEKISDYRNQILALSGIRRCPSCNLDVPMNAAFCCYCGKPLPELPKKPNGLVCPNPKCGAPVVKGNLFCTACGTRLDSSDIEFAPVKPATEKHEVVNEPVCPKCGAKVKKGNDFCTECGTRVCSVSLDLPVADEIILEERTCPKCGAKAIEGNAFCVECGTRL